VKAYLAAGGKPDFGEQGSTLLMEAAYDKQLEVVKVLIDAGADVNAHNDAGDTPLSDAVEWSFTQDGPKDPKVIHEIALALVDKGARVDDAVLAAAFKQAEHDLEEHPKGKQLHTAQFGWWLTLLYLCSIADDKPDPETYARAHRMAEVAAVFESQHH
jgi:hypothetical protein